MSVEGESPGSHASPGADTLRPDDTSAVSIIIAAYNAAAYLDDAIVSAQNQTITNIEILVVDDASDDETRTIARARATADPRVQLIALPANGGPGAARNAGLDRARGAWVAVLDADDRFAPNRLERLLALGAETGADMVADNLRLCYPDRSETLLSTAEPGTLTVDACSFIAANKGQRNQGRQTYGFLKPMVRRSLLRRCGIRYHEIRLAEDYFFSLECLIHGARWVVTRAPLYDYAVRETSLTATFKPSHLDAMAQVDRLLLEKTVVRARPDLRNAIADHLAVVTRAATWTRFVGALRDRDLRLAGQVTLTDAKSLQDVLRESVTAAPRVLARLAKSRVSKR